MKKFMKVCAITALVFLVLGAALALIGGSLQGRQKMQEIVDKVTGGKLKINLGEGSDGWGISAGEEVLESFLDTETFFDADEGDVLFDKKFDIFTGTVHKYPIGEDIRELDIEVGACVFETKESDDNSFWLEADNIGKLQCYVENQKLYVKSSRKGRGKVNWGTIKTSTICLYVPADFVFDEVSIELGAGMMDFDNLNSAKTELEVGAGQINTKNLKSDEMSITVGVGEIVVKKMQVGTLHADVGMGNLEIDGMVSEKADLECAMGNITFRVDGEKEDFNYNVECSMGNINLDGDEYSGISQNRKINNGAEKFMDIECSMGNIEISF